MPRPSSNPSAENGLDGISTTPCTVRLHPPAPVTVRVNKPGRLMGNKPVLLLSTWRLTVHHAPEVV